MGYRQLGGKPAMKPLRDRTHRTPQSRDSGFKQEGGGAEVFGTRTFSVVETKVLSFSLEPCCSVLSSFKCIPALLYLKLLNLRNKA